MKHRTICLLILLALLAVPISVAAQAPSSTSAGTLYTVEAGDWLSKIAAKLLGDAKRYDEIVAATNARAKDSGDVDAIDDPNLIIVGQRIWVPTASTEQTASPDWAYKAIVTTAGGQHCDLSLYLDVDGTARLKTDRLDGTAPVTNTGTWQVRGQEVTVDLPGTPGSLYEQAKTLRFTVREHQLVSADGLPVLTSFQTMSWERLAPPYRAEAVQAVLAAGKYAGTYKAYLPSASCCGLDLTLYLQADGTARLVSDYTNGEEPIVTEGTWAAVADGVTVTWTNLAGQEAFAEADVMRLRPEAGVLVSQETTPEAWGYRFYAVEGLADAG
ncbi:MAG: copper resistance protein NlpE N-terminal domain-containing protein [Anaerolineales bacterium]